MKKILLLLTVFASLTANAIVYTSSFGYYEATMISDCTPALVTFNSLSTPIGTFSKKIDFADGTPLTNWVGPAINHNYTVAGTYDTYVLYYDSGGSNIGYEYCRIEIYGQPGPVTNVYGATDACPFDNVRMAVSQGWNPSPDFSYAWDWGDGSPIEISSQNDLQHVYTSTGLFNIAVTTTLGPCGGTFISNGTMNISNSVALPSGLSYACTVYEEQACPYQDIYFYYPTEYASTFVQWGDGATSTSDHTHAYSSVGTYYPQVTITNGCGMSETFKDTIEIVSTLPWSSTMYYDINYNSTICPGGLVYFQTWINAASFAWYDEANNLLSTNNYFQQSFTSSDSIYLVATNGCGFDTTIYTPVTVTTTIPINPSDFDAYVTDSACTGALFTFSSDNNDPDPDISYTWDFGDGTILNEFSGSHEYLTGGTYTITVTATNTCGMDSTTTFPMYVGPGVAPDPNSIFYFVPNDGDGSVCPGDSNLFVGLSYLSDATYLIDFGDGNFSTTPTELNIFGQHYFFFTHAYSAIGTYNTTLTFTNGCGMSIVKSQTVNVGSNAEVSGNAFYDESANICFGDPINFYGFGGSQFIWDFGDGSGTLITYSPMEIVPHIYEEPGAYSVNVQITNGCGNTDFVDDINILVPDNKIHITTNTIDAQCHEADGKAIAVITGGNPPYNVIWSNGATSILVDSLTSGIYVCNVTDQYGCYKFGIATVSDAQAPAIIVNTVQDVTCNGGNDGVIDINVIGSSAPYSYDWSNGSSSEDQAGLVAGPYELYVTDANGCIATASITVKEPDEVLVSFIVTNANCGMDDGKIIASANGTSGPFTYVWNTGDFGQILSSVGLGLYEVNVIDSKGCIVTKGTSIDEDNGEGGPAIALNTISDLDCGGAGSTIDISVFASVGTPTFSWSTSETTEDINVSSEGTYIVTVTDPGTGCQAIESFTIDNAAPVAVDVCIVTVDSAYNANKVVWEKPVTTNIDYFKIYRESSLAGLYYHVGTVPYDSLSVFTDVVANPQIQAWRYKISVVDNCGAESALSEEHKTIHLNQNVGVVGGTVNLIWDDYEGMSFSTFNVLRYTDATGYVSLAAVSSLNFSYTDVGAPLTDTSLFYIITIDLGTPCVATRAQNNNTVRSNRVGNGLAPPPISGSVQESAAGIGYSHIYPNPTNGNMTIEFEVTESANYSLQIIDAIGNVVMTQNCGRVDAFFKKEISLNEIERGVYFVNIISKNGRKSKRIIKM